MINTKINIESFCTASGLSFSDKKSLIKTYGRKEAKSYSDWFDLVVKGYVIPKDLRKQFKPTIEKVEKVTKPTAKPVKEKSKSKELLDDIEKSKKGDKK